jgi:hypothetical protein
MSKTIITKIIMMLNLVLICSFTLAQSNPFKEVFTQSHLEWKAQDKDEWIECKTIVVFNYNDGTDIMMYKPDGTSELYTSINGFKIGLTDSGIKYQ